MTNNLQLGLNGSRKNLREARHAADTGQINPTLAAAVAAQT